MENMYNNIGPLNSWNPVDLVEENKEKSSKLFLGNINAYKDKFFLMENKIHAIVSIIKEPIPIHNKELIKDHLIIPIDDSETADILLDLEKVMDFIENHLDMGESVFVHCMAGSSRSASFVIAYLMRKNIWCFEKSYLFLKNKRAQVYPNSGFMRQLRIYEKTLFGLGKNMEKT